MPRFVEMVTEWLQRRGYIAIVSIQESRHFFVGFGSFIFSVPSSIVKTLLLVFSADGSCPLAALFFPGFVPRFIQNYGL